MCGIVGYVSDSADERPLEAVLEGLRRLEYRGYDSAGVAAITPGGLRVVKRAGRLRNLLDALAAEPVGAASTAIGHTRWATHGGPTDANAHPHRSADGRLALVHNGIVENFAQLRDELRAEGDEFASETDTEVVAHLLGRAYAEAGDLTEAMRATVARLTGAFTLLAVHADAPHEIVAARRNSPLVAGIGDGFMMLGSDVAAFIACTSRALELGQDQIITVTPGGYRIIDFDGRPADGTEFEVTWDASAAVKGGFPTFMEKEIAEQPDVVAATLAGRLDEHGRLRLDAGFVDDGVLRSADKIVVIACGTAANAGHVAKYAIEHWTRIPVEVELASEFRYRDPVVTERTLVVAISQSGETMDTIMAIRHAREQGAKVIAIVNAVGSTIARESDAVLYTRAGPEVAVAATKTFLAQIAASYILGLYLAQLRGNLYGDEVDDRLANLAKMPAAMSEALSRQDTYRAIARALKDTSSVLFLGRHVGYPVALEGALKLKELAYIHAEGFAAGELKHGPIALIEPGRDVIVVVPTPRRELLHGKVISNIQEINARGAHTIVIAEDGDTAVLPFADEVLWVPPSPTLLAPLVYALPLQLFACELATAKGLDVDQPRNLAKSVTVE